MNEINILLGLANELLRLAHTKTIYYLNVEIVTPFIGILEKYFNGCSY